MKFRIQMMRTKVIEQSTIIEIEADSEDDAREMAHGSSMGSLDWNSYDQETQDYRIGTIDKVEG